ncbi:MAG: hypothetical protein HRU20_22455 [Pseudomonadales bacterium]|nr:hypothetical protein [Pseudomonadales bacterium]
MRSLNQFFFYSVILLLVCACTTEPAVKKNRMQVGSILLLPVSSVHDDLLKGADQVDAEIERQLKSDDFQVYQLPPIVVDEMKAKALELSGSVYDPKIKKSVPLDKAKYNYHLVSLIAHQYDFDVLIMPQLWLRTTRMNVDEAQWDGVSREIEFINKPETTYKLPRSARGVSLRFEVFSGGGGKVDASFGGMSLPYKIDYAKGKAGFHLKSEFYTRREIKDAVKIVVNHLKIKVKAK